jgi:enoyl-CoA hydratase/carnithine racemase
VRAGKQVVQRILSGHHDDDDDYFALVCESVRGPDFAEGLDAFLSKRKPEFPVK